MNNQDIIDNASKGATVVFNKNAITACGVPAVTELLIVLKPRSLADIKRIVELENEKLTLCKSELETYALVMANARRLIKANVRTSNGRLFSELFGTGFGTGRDSARSLGLNPDCNKTDYNQMRRHIDLEALKEPKL
jgi:hypothetical protein